MQPVQSAITNMSFPRSFADNQDAIEKVEDWLADFDTLFDFTSSNEDPIYWTAPRWTMERDVLFFYLTKSSKDNIRRLARSLDEESLATGFLQKLLTGRRGQRLKFLLNQAAKLSEEHSGTVFACAKATGPAKFIPPEKGYSPRFESNVFAPVSNVHVFARSLSTEELADYIRIRQGAVTPLHGKAFQHVKDFFAERNELPDYLRDAVPAARAPEVGPEDDWVSIARREDVRFVDEEQLREFLLDPFLEELKDEDTFLHRECRCLRKGKGKHRADYFVKIYGAWIPVEAKLNVKAEKDIHAQLAEYSNIDSFVPTLGFEKGKECPADTHSVCLVADQFGVYVFSNGEFSGCSPGKPIWRREELDHPIRQTIRDRIREVVSHE